MREFFHGWRRKAGCVLLVMAIALILGWIRSLFVLDFVDFGGLRSQGIEKGTLAGIGTAPHSLVFFTHNVSFISTTPLPGAGDLQAKVGKEGPIVDTAHQSTAILRCLPVGTGFALALIIPFSSITLPLILFSAYLLLWPGKHSPKSSETGEAT